MRCPSCGTEAGAAPICLRCGALTPRDRGHRSSPATPDPEAHADGATLAAWVQATTFSTTRIRPGYVTAEVDAFAEAIRDTFLGVREPPLTPDEIRAKRFKTSRRSGYDEEEVDAFLEEVEARLAAPG